MNDRVAISNKLPSWRPIVATLVKLYSVRQHCCQNWRMYPFMNYGAFCVFALWSLATMLCRPYNGSSRLHWSWESCTKFDLSWIRDRHGTDAQTDGCSATVNALLWADVFAMQLQGSHTHCSSTEAATAGCSNCLSKLAHESLPFLPAPPNLTIIVISYQQFVVSTCYSPSRCGVTVHKVRALCEAGHNRCKYTAFPLHLF